MTGRGFAFAGALLAAVAVHAGVFAIWEPTLSGGAQSAGADGAALVSVAPSSAAMEARVADWERPPEATTAQPQMPQPEAPPEATPPKPQDTPPRIAATSPALSAPPAPDAALPAQADPAPPKVPRPMAKPKPPAPKVPTKEKASRPAQAQPDLRAKGQGGTAAAGNNQTAPSATLSAGQVRSLMGAWGGQIRARIERHKIPPEGVGAGRVLLALNVARDGRLLGVSVAKSSGKAALDRAAVDAVRRAGRFPAAPKGLGEQSYSFTLPMAFR